MRHNRTGNISGRNSFNPRICKRCDNKYEAYHVQRKGFNPRICKRCDSFQIQFSATKIRFNPRICKRCDLAVMYGYIFCSVSIHASVKDATSLRNFIMFRSFVSIHASVKDATYGKEIEVADPAFVSIHASVKDATTSKPDILMALSVSIHASVKDATPPCRCCAIVF